jgi:hypothetical protein
MMRLRTKGGIYLTQVGWRSAADREGLSGLVGGVAGVVPGRGCLSGLPGVAALAGRFGCPRCAGRTGWRLSSGRWECAVCGRQASVTAGTIFHRTRTPLRMWFAAAWQMTSQKHGVSAGRPAVARAGLLPDGVGDPAPLPHGDGAPPAASDWPAWSRSTRRRSAVSKPESTAGRPRPSRSSRSRSRSSTPRVSGGFDCNASMMSPRTA